MFDVKLHTCTGSAQQVVPGIASGTTIPIFVVMIAPQTGDVALSATSDGETWTIAAGDVLTITVTRDQGFYLNGANGVTVKLLLMAALGETGI